MEWRTVDVIEHQQRRKVKSRAGGGAHRQRQRQRQRAAAGSPWLAVEADMVRATPALSLAISTRKFVSRQIS